jgi:hypothetical protein
MVKLGIRENCRRRQAVVVMAVITGTGAIATTVKRQAVS